MRAIETQTRHWTLLLSPVLLLLMLQVGDGVGEQERHVVQHELCGSGVDSCGSVI